jgi:Nitrous oxide-stimulated promoter
MIGLAGNGAAEAPFTRRGREFKMIAAMLRMYCAAHHRSKRATLCQDCVESHDYARRRLERCVFGEAKPTCANCTVHCYKANMRERIKEVMRWAGPRMLWHHPPLAVRHMIDGRLPTPILQRSR